MVNNQATNENTQRLVKASARHLHIAPRKMRPVTNLLLGMNVNDAIVQLQHMPKKAAPILIKLLKSAVANAQNNFSLDTSRLFIRSIQTDMGKLMKRYFPRARGSAFVIRRKMSHVNVVLEERKEKQASKNRLALFKKKETETPASVDSQQATSEKPKKGSAKQKTIKTEEQVKMNTVQQKRRLFNRKAGE
jgi:large subunit ribosomal protein L22